MLFPDTPDNVQYRRGNADAHRVRPPSCVPPTLVSHQAFWISHPDQSQRAQDRRAVKRAVDNVILEIAGWTKQTYPQASVKIDPEIENLNVLFTSITFPTNFTHVECLFLENKDLNLDKLSAAQLDVLESDRRVISILFEVDACDVTIRFEFHTEYFTISTFVEIANHNHPQRRRLMDQMQSDDQFDALAAKQEFYHDFWWDLTNKICQGNIRKRPIFSQLFCDFRGIVITNEELLKKDKTDQLIDRYLPLLGPIGVNEWGHECSVCYMLGGRALYMTALGPQLPHASGKRRDPVTFLLCVGRETTKWQRGGLVDLIHAAGTRRLAALKDLSALRRAGSALAGLDSHTAAARSAVSDHHRRSGQPPPAGQTPPLDASESIGVAQDYFSAITKHFNEEVQGNYGILYRVERSRYYVARFRANAAQMRVERIERFQTYDQFVENRMGATFDYIDRLGLRYERGVNALALLDSYNLSIQSNEIAISQRQTEEKETIISDNIRKIQEYGDFILIAVLLPYYVTALIAHIYGEGEHETIRYFAGMVWTITFVLAMCKNGKEPTLLKNLRWAIGLAIVVWLCIWGFQKAVPFFLDKVPAAMSWIWTKVVPLLGQQP